ncbi:sensor histidine kinase [Aquabacterium sp. OR-4]|uniref:sensor histidine kinase n=1 Tax=Aquabacterium sp. OR-4 TaxID=2978127 RepID=UPI0021B26A75|nr:sensor histidine kinase [Aquabacterium sp. OR-4]MDT7835316.1 sensor histidine kinase [Aquabacterium sp. OR-4]
MTGHTANPRRHGPSLRRQLLQPLVWVWGLGLAVAVVGALWLARTATNRAFDRGLQDEVSALASRVVWSERGPLLDLTRQAMELITWDQADRNAFALVDLDGNALAGSAEVPVPHAPMRREARGQPLLFDDEMQGHAVRGAVFSIMSPMLDRMVTVIVVETTQRRAETVRELQISMLLPAAAMGSLTFGLLGWGIRRGLQPLRDVAAEVSARGPQDWQPLSLMRVPAEAVPLIERINRLLDDVQQSVAVQRRFIADAAHQLRTPVSGMRVLLQALEQEMAALPLPAADAGWRPILQQLRGSSDRMARLIGQLLSLARAESTLTIDADLVSHDILPTVREACEPLVLRALAAERQIALEVLAAPGQAEPSSVVARMHPLWLGEVLVNLLDNALRYGGQHIVVRVRAGTVVQGGGAEVIVEDDGPGVPPDQLPRLFEPFWRGERADLRNDGGTGLGLAIAREIVTRLGGTLEAASRPQVAGMRLTIRLQG